jgi:putative membrane protein
MIAHLTFGNAWFSPRGWTWDPELWAFGLAAIWAYALGRRRLRTEGTAGPAWRSALFYVALGVTLFALQSPFDALSDSLLSVHMVQHMLLLVIAAPLFAASTPWPELRRAMPPRIRGWLERVGRAADGTGWIGKAADVFWHPATALILFVGTLWVWHIPSIYDLAVHDQFVHEQEHLLYLATGVLYWSHALGTSWLAARMGPAQRIVFLVLGMVACWMLSLVLIVAQAPLYPAYVSVVSTVSGLSPIADQRLAAGLMWAAGMVPFNLGIALAVLRMLTGEEQAERAQAVQPEEVD